MHIKEAKEIIKDYVLEEFDERWSTDPSYIEEHPDFFVFYLTSKKYLETLDFRHQPVGLGQGFISKRYGDLVQYGSGQAHYARRDFLMTEYKLNTVRTQYKIGRTKHNYQVIIKNISYVEKAFKYIHAIKIYSYHIPSLDEIKSGNNLEFSSLNYFGLLSLLYFNILDPFCEISYQEIIGKYDQRYFCSNDFDHEDVFFQNHILNKVLVEYPSFEVDQNYQVTILEIQDEEILNQYLPIAYFGRYGQSEITGYIGYDDYTEAELKEILKSEDKSFEFIDGRDLLFFLLMNITTPFCTIEMKTLPVNRNGTPR